MSRINKKPINLGLKALSILIFSILIIPAVASADYVYDGPSINQTPQTDNNSWQIIDSISPSSANGSVGAENVIIAGDGFQPTSIARVNGSDRPTTFIDNSHLLLRLNPNDTNRTDGGFYITVFNGASFGNGSYSNSAFFTVNHPVYSNNQNNNYGSSSNSNNNNSSNSSNNNSNSSNTNQTGNNSTNNASDLASGVIFGTNNLLPSGLIQWILFAILILVIVVLARKIFGGEERYHNTPMKHE